MNASDPVWYSSVAGRIRVDALSKQILGVANRLLSLPQFGGEVEPMTGLQGSWRPRTQYSGTTHTACSVEDLTAYNWRNRVIVLDLLGKVAFHRTPSQGDWPEHLHDITNGMGCVPSSAKGQITAAKAGKDGLVGNRPDPDKNLRSGLWPLAVFQGHTGRTVAVRGTTLHDGPASKRKVLRTVPKGTVVTSLMEVNVRGRYWFVTDKGEWGYSPRWTTGRQP